MGAGAGSVPSTFAFQVMLNALPAEVSPDGIAPAVEVVVWAPAASGKYWPRCVRGTSLIAVSCQCGSVIDALVPVRDGCDLREEHLAEIRQRDALTAAVVVAAARGLGDPFGRSHVGRLDTQLGSSRSAKPGRGIHDPQ